MMKVFQYSMFISYILLVDYVVAEVYRVGDESGWNSGTGTNYLSWSEPHNFIVGDLLVFKYSKLQHNVKEVTDATYRSCDASSGVIATYRSGNDEIKLSEAKKYNFICDKDNHCIGGMRFSINVFGGYNSNKTTPSEPPLSPPPPSQPQNSVSIIRGKLIHIVGILLIPIFMF